MVILNIFIPMFVFQFNDLSGRKYFVNIINKTNFKLCCFEAPIKPKYEIYSIKI